LRGTWQGRVCGLFDWLVTGMQSKNPYINIDEKNAAQMGGHVHCVGCERSMPQKAFATRTSSAD
jgi:hypothetical protein